MTGKEKTIKELKEALDSLDITNKYRLNLIRAIEYLQEEHVSEDLEEAAKSYSNNLDNICGSIGKQTRNAFKNGAKWQKEQMMAEAIETTFNVSLPSGLYDKLWIKGCKESDKLLVIKKDQL